MKLSEHMIGGIEFSKLKVAQVMESEVETFGPGDNWLAMVTAMTRLGYGSVPITTEDGTLIGIVSEYDLLEVLMNPRDLSEVTAVDIMTDNPVSTTEDELVTQVVNVLETRHLIHMPVVREGKLVGIVARRDVLSAYIAATSEPPKWL